MKAFKIFVALLVMAVFVTAGSGFADDVGPYYQSLYEDKLSQSEKSMTGGPEQAMGLGPLSEDRHGTEKGINIRSEDAKDRFLGIQPSWE